MHTPEGSKDNSLLFILTRIGFDQSRHDRLRHNYKAGRIGLLQNRLSSTTQIEDVTADDITFAEGISAEAYRIGIGALQAGEVAVVTFAAGAGSRWEGGHGAVKALSPLCNFVGGPRSFLEVHIAKTLATARSIDRPIAHAVTTSFLTHDPITTYLNGWQTAGVSPVVSRGLSHGLRVMPTIADLKEAWPELSDQSNTFQTRTLLAVLNQLGDYQEAANYMGGTPRSRIYPLGHWHEVPNMLLNGMLNELLTANPQLKWLFVHNLDTVGVHLDPALLGHHITQGACLTYEVIPRHSIDRGGYLARVDGRARLLESLAMPRPADGDNLRFYNTLTTWVDIDKFLHLFGLTRATLRDQAKVEENVRRVARLIPTYATLKQVSQNERGQSDGCLFVTQFENLWGDMTALPQARCSYIVVGRHRGSQLKTMQHLKAWLASGSKAYVDTLCAWR